MVNIITQCTTLPASIKLANGDLVSNPTPADHLPALLALGWRFAPYMSTVAPGYERRGIRYIEGDGRTASYECTIVNLSDEAAANAARDAQEQARIDALPFRISKEYVVEALDNMGKLSAFDAMLASDEKASRFWKESVVVDSNHPKVVAMLPYLSQIIGSDALTFLKTCKSEIV